MPKKKRSHRLFYLLKNDFLKGCVEENKLFEYAFK